MFTHTSIYIHTHTYIHTDRMLVEAVATTEETTKAVRVPAMPLKDTGSAPGK
jgi:hypothetical protein